MKTKRDICYMIISFLIVLYESTHLLKMTLPIHLSWNINVIHEALDVQW